MKITTVSLPNEISEALKVFREKFHINVSHYVTDLHKNIKEVIAPLELGNLIWYNGNIKWQIKSLQQNMFQNR